MASKSKKKKMRVESSVEEMLTDASAIKSNKKKKINKDDSWADAVTKARGEPDGAPEGGQDENLPQSKGSQVEKVLKKAAKKLIGKNDDGEDDVKKAVKRKHTSGETNQGTGKKPKIEELSFKDRKKQRKTQKSNYDDSLKAKKLWEQIRRHDLSAAKRKEHVGELYSFVQGRAKELIFAHDTCRVIQCVMQYGDEEQRGGLFEELREHIIEMTKSKYAKFFVRKLLKYGTKSQRNFVFKTLYGNIRKLIKHKEAAEIVELAYNDFANAQQRASLAEEFYGPSFALFKTEEARTIDQIMASNPEKRDSILSNMKETLSSLIDKNLCQYSIIHKIFLEYFRFATDKARREMIELVRENLIHMLHTREGARITMHCIWSGTVKDRKVIIKSMKSYILKICKEEFGHLTLLAAFDVVDDTKLVQKAILEEMFKSVDEVAKDQFGRKVLLYILFPRDTKHFHPDVIKILEQGDSNTTSKKDQSVRRAELLAVASEYLLKYISTHTKDIVTANALLLLLESVLKHAIGDKSSCYKALAAVAAEDFVAGQNVHIVDHPAGHLALKRLILNDKEKIKEGKDAEFSTILIESVSKSNFKAWASCNRGCFIIITLIDLEVPSITAHLKSSLKTVAPSLGKMTFKGAQILLTKLKT